MFFCFQNLMNWILSWWIFLWGHVGVNDSPKDPCFFWSKFLVHAQNADVIWLVNSCVPIAGSWLLGYLGLPIELQMFFFWQVVAHDFSLNGYYWNTLDDIRHELIQLLDWNTLNWMTFHTNLIMKCCNLFFSHGHMTFHFRDVLFCLSASTICRFEPITCGVSRCESIYPSSEFIKETV